MCGGTIAMPGFISRRKGPSPRVRGNPRWCRRCLRTPGTIPACAGEPMSNASCSLLLRDHPRVCGGTGFESGGFASPLGPSPRVRGNLQRTVGRHAEKGTIPACAGEPIRHGDCRSSAGDHPRVCGGTVAARVAHAAPQGPSPRVRGNHHHAVARLNSRGTIPACAGEPSTRRRRSLSRRDHPRVCGGTECSLHPIVAGRDHPRVCGGTSR